MPQPKPVHIAITGLYVRGHLQLNVHPDTDLTGIDKCVQTAAMTAGIAVMGGYTRQFMELMHIWEAGVTAMSKARLEETER